MPGQVTGPPTTTRPEATTEGPMGGQGALPEEAGILLEGEGPLLKDEEEVFLEMNCSMPCSNYTAHTNSSSQPGDSYYFYEVSTAYPSFLLLLLLLFFFSLLLFCFSTYTSFRSSLQCSLEVM